MAGRTLTKLHALALALLVGAAPAAADVLSPEARGAEVVILGEVHDNPEHHRLQAAAVAEIAPTALVFEMIAKGMGAEVDALRAAGAGRDEIAEALDWAASGWPDFALYAPILEAAPGARIFGAARPRAEVRRAFAEGAAEVFGPEAARFGLDHPLPPEEQAAREALQFDAHCAAMPREMMAGLVAAQRFRDAAFASAVLRAVEETGGPVVLITGNGHARTDWGVPAALDHARPDLSVHAVGMLEAAADAPPFDSWHVTDAPERGDPCAALTGG
ncbi:MAG: ChaN family lipoprotein [Pseudomonadota bacterium]